MSRFIDRLANFVAIHNITIYLITLILGVNFLAYSVDLSLGVITPEIFQGRDLYNILLYPFRFDSPGEPSIIWTALHCYVFWLFGNSLEQTMGTPRYSLYLLLGIFIVTISSLVLPVRVNAEYIYYSVFLAIAYLAPQMEIYLLFIPIPIKIKWIAWITIGMIVLGALQLVSATGSFWPLAGPIISFANFLIFFGPGFFKNRTMQADTARRKQKFKAVESEAFHRCAVCGITEKDDPRMQFRYCVDCTDHEYCEEHLNNHTHQ